MAVRRTRYVYVLPLSGRVWTNRRSTDVASKMDKQLKDVEKELDTKLANFGWNNDVAGKQSIQEMLLRQGQRVVGAPATEVRDEIKNAKNIDLFRDVQ